MGERIEMPALAAEGMIPAWIERPAGPARAAVLVIPEIFGVNEGIRRKCAHWAAKGYLAVAPDIFWRFAPGVELDPDVPEQLQEAFGYFQQYNADDGVKDIEAAIRWIRTHGDAEMVGLVGYCLGGRLAYMAATRTDIDASVGYYGVMIDQMLGESHAIANPLMLHIAGADHFVLPEAQTAIHAGLDGHHRVTLHDYPGEDHGFAAEMGARRSEAAAGLADSRTEAFLAEHLA
jgi:carboxymethylenebutenolidase